MNERELLKEAMKARERSYCPYSGYAVGAALLTKDQRVICGCNVENASYTPTICAERCAIFKAVSEGITEFEAIAIAGGPKGEAPTAYAYPCGVCRQVMSEFCDAGTFRIIVGTGEEDLQSYTLEELLPHSFGK